MIERVPLFFGWKVVAASFVIAVFAWGIGFYGPSVFMVELHRSRGWPIAVTSAAITGHFLLSALIVAYLGDLHRRFGIAHTTIAGIASTAIGIIVWANVGEIWHLVPAAVLTGAGWAATSGAAINTMVSPWFDRNRPTALSYAFNGASVGGVVFAPLWIVLIDHLGFAGTAALVAAISIVVLWPLSLHYLIPTPASLGLYADSRARVHDDATPIVPRLPIPRRSLAFNTQFITMSGAFALALFAQIGVITHLLTHLSPVLGGTLSAAMLSVAATCAVIGRTLLAWLIGERDRRVAAAGSFLMQAVGVLLIAFGPGVPPLAIGCVLFGLGIGNLVSLPPLIAQREFDHADVMQVVALATAINQTVFAFAPAVLGAIRDATGNYSIAFSAAVAAQLGAIALVLIGRRSSRITRT